MPFSAEWVHQQSNELRKKLGLRPILLPHEQDDRVIHPHIPEASAQFCDNVVTTSRYTWYNFVPVFLFNQFTRFANAYFLCVAILQTIPEISITNGVPTTFLPLSIVLGFDGLVTAREDYKRHQDDAKANASQSELVLPSFLPLRFRRPISFVLLSLLPFVCPPLAFSSFLLQLWSFATVVLPRRNGATSAWAI